MSGDVHVRFCESRGVRFPPATHLVVLCRSQKEAEDALSALTAILHGLGLEPKASKTRIVHLVEGTEGLDFPLNAETRGGTRRLVGDEDVTPVVELSMTMPSRSRGGDGGSPPA